MKPSRPTEQACPTPPSVEVKDSIGSANHETEVASESSNQEPVLGMARQPKPARVADGSESALSLRLVGKNHLASRIPLGAEEEFGRATG